MRICDAHQHYWRRARGDYGWLPRGGVLDRDFLPQHLAPANQAAGVVATVAVQAAPTVAETDFLLELAGGASNGIAGVVGWAPLERPDGVDVLAERAGRGPLVGVRPMLQDLEEVDWLARRVPAQTLRRLVALDLTLDLLVRPAHLPAALAAVERVPDLRVVLDHLGKPDYRERSSRWVELVERLAARPNSFCKLSGIVTEPGGRDAGAARFHAEHVLSAFGPDRVLFGSDWPVCLTATDHASVVALARELTDDLDPTARDEVFWGTVSRAYPRLRLPDA
jgi:L-fuconolactonase